MKICPVEALGSRSLRNGPGNSYIFVASSSALIECKRLTPFSVGFETINHLKLHDIQL